MTFERCYSVDALTFVSSPVYCLLVIAECVIVDLGVQVLKSDSVLARLIAETVSRSGHIKFPDCHEAKMNILNLFFRVRIFSYLRDKKVSMKAKDRRHLKAQAEGSRSMSMRESVKDKH